MYFVINVDYDNSSIPYRATKLKVTSYIYPERSGGISNGFVDATITETADFSSNEKIRYLTIPSASYWKHESAIYPTPAHEYFNLSCSLNKDFVYSLEEKGYFFFTCKDANLYYKRDYTGILSISTPK